MTSILAMLRGLFHRPSRHQTKVNNSYEHGYFNRAGTKLVRRWYGEEAAKRYNQ